MASISKELHVPSSYPSSEFLMVFGFLIMLAVEQIMLTYHEKMGHSEEATPFLGHRHGNHHHHHGSLDHPTAQRQNSLEGISSQPHSPTSSGRFDSRSGSSETWDEDVSIHADPSSHSLLRSMILVIALLFHSVFEGLAIGLQDSNEDALSIFLAVILHKVVLGFSVGLNLAQSALTIRKILLSNTLFALSSPLGIVIGIAIMDAGETQETVISEVVLQGIACGTFIYVTFFEVLPHEFNNSQCRLGKLVMLILGFGCIAGMMFLETGLKD